MWPFKKKASSRSQEEPPSDLLEQVLELKKRVNACEREAAEQHDFIRRLASRRAKETQVDRATSKNDTLDDVPMGRESSQTRKSEIWNRVRSKQREHLSEH